ncbi:MAG: ATP-binding protein, partial [Planctomycetota bacterium]
DVTVARQGALELEQAKVAGEDSARAKLELLAKMSQEIRTPMIAILGYADLLGSGELDRDQGLKTEAVGSIRANGLHLLRLIGDVLDVSKAEAGKLRVERLPTDLVPLIDGIVATCRPSAQEAGLALDLVWDGQVPSRVETDPTRLRQVLLNLVGNALKFTRQGSVTLRVRCDREREQLVVRVRDTGIGMTPAQCVRIRRFEAFTQADASTTRRFGGTGLGLRISSQLVQLLGGELSVTSTLGVGSEFVASVGTGALRDAEWIDGAAWTPDRREQGAAGGACATAARPLEGARILLVDDGADNRRLLSLYLTRAGAQVELAEDGRQAVDQVSGQDASERPELVLMDMQMPVLDGYAATAELRALGFERPILAVTAHALEDDRQRCLEAGCDDFVTKPVDRAALIERCEAWIARGAGDRAA